MSENTSGIWPVEFKCLVLPDEVAKASAGGIQFTLDVVDKEQQGQVKGVLIAAGASAFEDWAGRKVSVGTRIYFAKYAGIYVKGDDGRQYRIINDKDIMAVCNG